MAIFGNMIGGGGDASKYGTTGDYFAGNVIGANTYSIAPYAFATADISTKIRTASFPNARVIGSHAFESCYNLIELDFPNVTTIEEAAFGKCSKLTTITSDMFPNLETICSAAFSDCKNLTRFEPSVKNLSAYAFYNTSTISVNPPTFEYFNTDYIEHIERSVFTAGTLNNCDFFSDHVLRFPRVKEFAVPLPILGSSAYADLITSIDMPMLKELLPRAFANHSSTGYAGRMVRFTGVFSHSTLEIIGSNAFDNNSSYTTSLTITGFDLPNLKEVYSQCINNLPITTLEFPELRFIGNYAFMSYGNSLANVSFPKYEGNIYYTPKYSLVSSTGSAKQTGQSAFYSCIRLKEVYMPKCSYFPAGFFNYCYQMESITFSSSQVVVSTSAFCSCQALSDINLEALRFVGGSAFYSCKCLPSVMHLENVTKIGGGAFASATHSSGGRTLYLSAISYIGNSAFANTWVKYIYMSGVSSVVELGGNASSVFTASTSLTYIYVPSSLYSDFRADANWSVYSTKFRSV